MCKIQDMKNFKKYFLFICILFLSPFILSGCTVSEEKVSEYERIVSDADLLIKGKEYSLALDKLNDATEIIPSRVDAFERIVGIFTVKNKPEDAAKVIEESGGQLSQSDKAKLYTLVGDAYYNLGEFDKAVTNYQLALGMSDKDMSASLGCAKAYLQIGQIEKAKDLLEKTYEGDMVIESNLLLSYIQALSDTNKAEEILKGIEPGDKWREAYTKWNEVLGSLNDDELFNAAKLGKEYVDRGYPYLAIALLEPKLSKMEEYADGLYILGKAYYENGDYRKSIDVLQDISTLGDLNQYIYWVLARDYYQLNDINSSIAYYDSAISYGASQAHFAMYKEYLDILMKENLTEKALEVMRSAEKIFTDTWVPLYYVKIYSLRDDSEKFTYYVNKVSYEDLDDSEKAEFLYSKGSYLIKKSKLDEAQEVLDVFWELNQYDPRYNLLVAEISIKDNDFEKAKEYAKKAIEYDLKGVVSKEAQTLLAQID